MVPLALLTAGIVTVVVMAVALDGFSVAEIVVVRVLRTSGSLWRFLISKFGVFEKLIIVF